MTLRSYGQFCSLARALDIVGSRWTLLLVRELLSGPKRFKDLLEALRGIGTNLLSQRLRELERAGLVRAIQLAAPISAAGYGLTSVGRDLEKSVLELARWGVQFRARPNPGDLWLPGWNVLALKAVFDQRAARGVDEEYELRVDDETVSVRVKDGTVETKLGSGWKPDLVFATDQDTFLGLVSGDVELRDAMQAGQVDVDGPADALQRFVQIFGGPQ